MLDTACYHHYGEQFITVMNRGKRTKRAPDRLTISLGKGQRELLEAIAATNRTSLAYIVRYALEKFAEENKDKQLQLTFPPDIRS